MKEIIITENESNQRLDRFLSKYLPRASQGFLQKMIRKKRIKVNKQKAEPKLIITVGDRLQIYFSEESIANFHDNLSTKKNLDLKKNLSLDIVYEDLDLLVINKPKDLLTQPDKSEAISLIDLAVDYLIKKGDYLPENHLTFTPACANRLDKNTSGIVLIPKTFFMLQEINQLIRDGQTQKIYYAMVLGIPAEQGEIIGYLKKDASSNTVTFSKEKTKDHTLYAALNYQNLGSSQGVSFLKITLLTGRSHQIRVQLASMGTPILGDPKYGNRNSNIKCYEAFGLRNQLLHNASFSLPSLEKKFIAPLPASFEKLLKAFGFKEAVFLDL